jgi:hypothetical protein
MLVEMILWRNLKILAVLGCDPRIDGLDLLIGRVTVFWIVLYREHQDGG